METAANSAETVEKATAPKQKQGAHLTRFHFKPGQSGNPNGSRKAPEYAWSCINAVYGDKYTDKQLERMAEKSRDQGMKTAARCVLLLNRDPLKYMHDKDGKRMRDERGKLIVTGVDPEPLRALIHFLDRGLGKPRQTVHVERSTTGDQLVAKVAELRALAESPLLDSLIAMRGNIIDVQSVPIRSDGDTNSADTA